MESKRTTWPLTFDAVSPAGACHFPHRVRDPELAGPQPPERCARNLQNFSQVSVVITPTSAGHAEARR